MHSRYINQFSLQVGVTQHAAEALGDVVYVELPEPGTTVSAGVQCAVVESVKAASDIIAPLSGTVTGKNETVVEDPGQINKAPLTDGWLYEFESSTDAEAEAAQLLSADEYADFLKGL